jgi:predicted nuclease of restriction endonuclease-like (RecB) superfamily
VGNRINQDVLQNNRAEYAKQIVSTLSTQLKERHGNNFELRNLRHMMQFAEQFTDSQIVEPLSRKLSWSHFVERQKRMIINGEDFNLDLLFYHRKLKRLATIELKLGKFQAKHKGQMELYLKWLDKYEKQEGENTPIGLILCAESSKEQIELLEMHKDSIMAAEYWTDLPPKKQFEEKIHLLIAEARERKKLL